MSTSTLTQFDRGAIYHLLKLGLSQNKIAKKLGFSKSTISYELKRIRPYDPIKAQADADQKRRHCGRHVALSATNKELIENHLKLTWSPEMIARRFGFCTASIYNWIYGHQLEFDESQLPEKGTRRRRQQENRGTFKVDHTIESRPESVNERTEFGHWEADTVLSSRGQAKTCLATFVERKTRFLWAVKIPDRTAGSMQAAIKQLTDRFGSRVYSLTVDHGKEFANYQKMEHDFHIKFYFCHPYTPSERGSNEYFNRKLRWFFPKQTNFNQVSHDQVIESLELINQRPLKILHDQTPLSAFSREFIKCSN